MALGSCKECGKQVSSEAETCPHCGIRDPALIDMDENTELDSSGVNEELGTNASVLVNGVATEAFLGAPYEPLPTGRSVDCIGCGEPLSAISFKCPKCGEFLPNITPVKLLLWSTVVVVFLIILPLTTMYFTKSISAPSMVAPDDVVNFCKALDSTGMLTNKCGISTSNQSVDIVLNTSSSEAKKMCSEIAAMDRHLGVSIESGWKLRIFSPNGNSIAACNF